MIAVIVGIYAYRQHSGLLVEQRLKDQQKRFADAFKSAFQAQAKASEATINWVQASADIKMSRPLQKKNKRRMMPRRRQGRPSLSWESLGAGNRIRGEFRFV